MAKKAQMSDSPAIAPDAIGIVNESADCFATLDQTAAMTAPTKNENELANGNTQDNPSPIADGR